VRMDSLFKEETNIGKNPENIDIQLPKSNK
jgi:hypothetical protein